MARKKSKEEIKKIKEAEERMEEKRSKELRSRYLRSASDIRKFFLGQLEQGPISRKELYQALNEYDFELGLAWDYIDLTYGQRVWSIRSRNVILNGIETYINNGVEYMRLIY